MAHRFPIYRSNEYNLRKQIMDILDYLGKFPVIKTTVDTGDSVVVPAGSQLIVYEAFSIASGGVLFLDGDLVVLGGAYRDEQTHSPYFGNLNQGNYLMSGADARIAASLIVQADAGSYAVTGSAATLSSDEHFLPSDSGSYAVTGSNATLTGP